jgi:hypothetical protein
VVFDTLFSFGIYIYAMIRDSYVFVLQGYHNKISFCCFVTLVQVSPSDVHEGNVIATLYMCSASEIRNAPGVWRRVTLTTMWRHTLPIKFSKTSSAVFLRFQPHLTPLLIDMTSLRLLQPLHPLLSILIHTLNILQHQHPQRI